MTDHTITRTAAGWYYRAWLTREVMFCKMCKTDRNQWIQLGGSVLMGDAPKAEWRFYGRSYRAKLRHAVRRHFAAEHPDIPIR